MLPDKNLINNVLFLNGITRAGKFFLGKIVAGLEDVEYFQYVSILEHLPFMERMDYIREEAAISLMQVNVDQHAYNMRIGRNLNLRYDDGSSLYNSWEIDTYLKRTLIPINKNFVADLKQKERFSTFILHDSLANINIFFKAFPKMKWINLVRHPVDVIHSWYLRGWGHRFLSDPLSFIPLIKSHGRSVPWYAQDWSEEYEAMSDIDRIVKSISVINEWGEAAYQMLSEEQKKQIHYVAYENLVEDTYTEINNLAAFLNTTVVPKMPVILAKERCPQHILLEKRDQKVDDIKKIAGKEMFGLMMDLADQYEKSKGKSSWQNKSNYYVR